MRVEGSVVAQDTRPLSALNVSFRVNTVEKLRLQAVQRPDSLV
jgi:hypothetical protein